MAVRALFAMSGLGPLSPAMPSALNVTFGDQRCSQLTRTLPPIGALCWDSLLRPCRVQSRKFCAERLRGTKAGGCGPTRLADAGSWHLLAVCRVCLASPDDAAVLLAWQQHPGPQAVSEDFAQMMFAELLDPHLVD